MTGRVKVSFEDWELEALYEVARKKRGPVNSVHKGGRQEDAGAGEGGKSSEAVEEEVKREMEAFSEEFMLRAVKVIELQGRDAGAQELEEKGS